MEGSIRENARPTQQEIDLKKKNKNGKKKLSAFQKIFFSFIYFNFNKINDVFIYFIVPFSFG